MRLYTALFLLFFLICADASAQFRQRKQRKWPATEGALMGKLMGCLQARDTAGYYELFPPFDTLWSMVTRNRDQSPEVQKELSNLKERPQILVEFDPLYNHDIIGGFCNVLGKGEDSGVQWQNMVMARYELRRQDPTRNLIGYDHIAPERFQGYLFVSDPSNRVVFCISLSEVQKIKGQFFGGQLHNVLEAKTVDEFHLKEERERAYFAWLAAQPDTIAIDSAITDTAISDSTRTGDTTQAVNPLLLMREEADDDDPTRREVIDRRYYEGTLDNEIPIKLYVRYMKAMPGKQQQFDGLYKLGENKRYLKLEIARTPEGKWTIEDESSTGIMELVLKGRTYTGAWINADENGFDVVLTQTGLPKGKMELLDRILDRGASGRVDESQFETEKPEKSDSKKDKEEQKNEKTPDGDKDTNSDKATTAPPKEGDPKPEDKKEERKKRRRNERKKD